MTKHLELDIDKYQAFPYLSAIRSKSDVIMLWMETIKNFLVFQPAESDKISARLLIKIEKMSRLFCTCNDGKKIFSIGFPFGVISKDGKYRFYSRDGVEIDNKVSSDIISLIRSGALGSQDFSKFIDPILEMSDYTPELWALIRELMVAEDGYIRYDWDEDRHDGHRHPIHHLDIYYSNASTFKIGLETQLVEKSIVSILDPSTDCHYLIPATT